MNQYNYQNNPYYQQSQGYPLGQPYPHQNYNQAYDPVRFHLAESSQIIQKYKNNVKGVDFEPRETKFATQNPNEKIFVFLRRHWTENIRWIVRNLVYSTFPFILYSFLKLFQVDLTFLERREIVLILASYYSLIVTNIMRDFFDWYFDPYIITNERIIHYEFKPFTKYLVKEANLADVESISEESAGLLAGLWGYGTLTVSTESQLEEDIIIFEDIPHPTSVRDILFDLSKVAKKYHGRT